MTIKKIMVIGAGQMGGGIAELSAQAGYERWNMVVIGVSVAWI